MRRGFIAPLQLVVARIFGFAMCIFRPVLWLIRARVVDGVRWRFLVFKKTVFSDCAKSVYLEFTFPVAELSYASEKIS